MSYKTIARAHEARMWLKDIIIPTVVIATMIATNPEFKDQIKTTVNNIRTKVRK